MCWPLRRVLPALALLAALVGPQPLLGQNAGNGAADPDTLVFKIDPLLVTATRGPRLISQTPRPVSVVDRSQVALLSPNSVSDLFRDIPGLDVTGVGANQARPAIRGQRGQRILLLADGLRMNNSRRQRDFGELPALVDVSAVEQVEIVRGPASVLYGSDAIGGVVNIITRVPDRDGLHGTASYRYSDVDGQNRVAARVSSRTGSFSLLAGGMFRNTDAYEAPGGTFGDITLEDDVLVNRSGVEDRSMDLRLGWDLSRTTGFFGKFETYQADDAGFGFVDPAAYSPGDPVIDITYPDQTFSKLTFGFQSREVGLAFADRVEVLAYGQDNERELVFNTFIPFGPTAGLTLDNRNFTDIRTYGFRAEARKLAGDVLLTYGVDGFRDRAEGTDENTSVITGFGPPQVTQDNRPTIPNAEYRSVGAFLQGEVEVGSRVSLVGGTRLQRVSAETFQTPNMDDVSPISSSDATVVGSLNALVHVTDRLDLVLSTGRGFRSPNLVELFFDGPVGEAGAYQVPNEDLKAETSFNVDVGARFHAGPVFVEGFVFRNKIYDGIRARPVTGAQGDTLQRNGLDVFQNVNLDEIVFEGVELSADVQLPAGFSVGAGYARLDAEDAIDPENPVGESFSEKVTGRLRYQAQDGLFWGQWEVRHSGEQKSVELGTNPLGSVIPSFTIQHLRGGVRLFELGGVSHGLSLAVTNLTNELYAETSNASFFRPEPKRNLTVTYEVAF
ncbi:MAG: TonB-dependent receptor [Longimicrobiales bacterium]|nr:TonB-dependent receptor [Longimicrobiales bacterium]